MTDLMKELMAEVARVNKLETEVDRAVELQKQEIDQMRKDKVQSIALTLQSFCDALIEADAMHFHNREAFFVLPGASFKEADGYVRSIGIKFYTDGVFCGTYYSGTGDCVKGESFNNAVNYKPCSKSMKALIDAWDEEMEKRVEEMCAKHIKSVLTSRMERMRNKLDESNTEHAKYVR